MNFWKLVILLILLSSCGKCVKSHTEHVHEEGYDTIIFIGDTIYPWHVDSTDYDIFVCDERSVDKK